jgi:hypothetical protein
MNAVSTSRGQRTLTVISAGAGEVTADVTAGGKTGRYTFARAAETEAATVYAVQEFGGERYTVAVHGYEPQLDACTCPAGWHGRRCKHIDATVALAARGKFD